MSTTHTGTIIAARATAMDSYPVGQKRTFVEYSLACECTFETDDGRLFIFSDDECSVSQVNFCPFTGKRAKVQIGE